MPATAPHSPSEFVAFINALGVATNAFRTHIRQQFKLHGIDLTAEMLQVLRYLWAHDGVNQQEIANAVNKDKATLTGMLDNLVRRELVARYEDSHDRRNKRITLTVKGRALEQRIAPLIQGMYDKAGVGVLAGQLRAGTDLLAQIAHSLED